MSEGDYQIAEARVQEVLDRQKRKDQDIRTTWCRDCGGDGGFEEVVGIDPFRSEPITRWFLCSSCQGTGEQEIELQPIDMDDLSAMGGESA